MKEHLTVPDLIFDNLFSVKCRTTPAFGDNIARFLRVKAKESALTIEGVQAELKVVEQKPPALQTKLEAYGKLGSFVHSRLKAHSDSFKLIKLHRTFEEGWDLIAEGNLATGASCKFLCAVLSDNSEPKWGDEFLKLLKSDGQSITLEYKLSRN